MTSAQYQQKKDLTEQISVTYTPYQRSTNVYLLVDKASEGQVNYLALLSDGCLYYLVNGKYLLSYPAEKHDFVLSVLKTCGIELGERNVSAF